MSYDWDDEGGHDEWPYRKTAATAEFWRGIVTGALVEAAAILMVFGLWAWLA